MGPREAAHPKEASLLELAWHALRAAALLMPGRALRRGLRA